MILGNAAATHQAGMDLALAVCIGDVIALRGDLGAGKTSLARGILAGLGLQEEAPSPSFALVIPYDPPLTRLPVWHVDLYRLETPDQCLELGLDEALSDGVLLIEWPDRMGESLWPCALNLTLEPDEAGGRTLTVTVPPSWEKRCPWK